MKLKTIHDLSSPARVLVACASVFFVLFTTVGLLIHQNIGTSAYDLGVFDQAYWRYSRLHDTFNTVLGFSILGDHFGVLAFVFGLFYALVPYVAWPIAAQTLSVAVGGLILFSIVRDRLPTAPVIAIAIALSYYLHPAVHSTLLWQFHEIVLASGLYMGLIWSYIKSNRRLYIACLLALLMCREDMPFTVAAFGLLALIDKRWREAVWAIGLAVIWWYFATKVAMPFFSGHGYWQALPGRPLATPLDNIANPYYYIERVSDRQSLVYTFQVLFPLGFVGLWSPRYLIPALPTLIANVLIGSYKSQIAYHYCVSIMPFVFWAATETLSRHQTFLRISEKRITLALSSSIVALTAIASSQYSALNLSQLPIMVQAWTTNAPNRKFLAELDDEIGYKGVAASDFLLPHLAHRDRIYLFPNPWKVHNWGLAGENPHHPNSVDYIVVSSGMRAEQSKLLDYLVEAGIFRVRYNERGIVVFQRIRSELESRAQAIAQFESFAPRPQPVFAEIAISPPMMTPEESFTNLMVDLKSIQEAVPRDWTLLPDSLPQQLLDLTLGEAETSDFRTVYVRTVIHRDHPSKVKLEIGSDDGVTVWVNGYQVHENIVLRGAVLGEDVVKLDLSSGKNVIVFRVNNARGAWRLMARVSKY